MIKQRRLGLSVLMAGLLIAMVAVPTYGSEATRQISISRVASVSVSRPAYPGSQSVFRVYSSVPGTWGSTNCRADAADVSLDDWHVYGVLLSAWKDHKLVDVTVESSAKIDTTDTVCKIVAAGVSG